MPNLRQGAGIGLLLDLALSTWAKRDVSHLDPGRWKGERAGGLRMPPQLGPGSHNFRVTARTLDRLIQRDDNHLAWLLAWYRGQNSGPLGHAGREILSPVYFDAHTFCASLNVQLCDERGDAPELRAEALRFLEDELALCTLHDAEPGTPGQDVVVAAGTRALTGASGSRDYWLERTLGKEGARGSSRLKAFRYGDWFSPDLLDDCRNFLFTRVIGSELDRVLSRIRSASGVLVWELYEDGHLSYFPEGPACYSSPQPVAVAAFGLDAVYLNPARESGRRMEGVVCRTRREGSVLISEALPPHNWSRSVDLSHLGQFLESRTFPMPDAVSAATPESVHG